MPSRKNGDPSFTHYKGVQKIISGIELFAKEAKQSTLKRTVLISLTHGNANLTYGHEEFNRDLLRIKDLYHIDIINIRRHLSAKAFWSICKDNRIAVLDQFGAINGMMGGVGRESCCFGRPVLTGTLNTNDYHTRELCGESAPIFTADNAQDIANFTNQFANLKTTELIKLNQKISKWALSKFDPEIAFNQIIETLDL